MYICKLEALYLMLQLSTDQKLNKKKERGPIKNIEKHGKVKHKACVCYSSPNVHFFSKC